MKFAIKSSISQFRVGTCMEGQNFDFLVLFLDPKLPNKSANRFVLRWNLMKKTGKNPYKKTIRSMFILEVFFKKFHPCSTPLFYGFVFRALKCINPENFIKIEALLVLRFAKIYQYPRFLHLLSTWFVFGVIVSSSGPVLGLYFTTFDPCMASGQRSISA
jgi:hypothetical protein